MKWLVKAFPQQDSRRKNIKKFRTQGDELKSITVNATMRKDTE